MTPTLFVQLRKVVASSSFLRFLISGGVNTTVTYATYLGLLQVTGYKTAFTLAYLVVISVAFGMNRHFVFKTHRGWRSVVMFPFVYVAQYVTSLAVVWLWVEQFLLPKEIAPLVAIAATIPLTFALSQLAFGQAHRNT